MEKKQKKYKNNKDNLRQEARNKQRFIQRRKGYKEGIWKKLVQKFPRRRETKFKRISEKLSKFEKMIFLFFVCYKRWLR